MFGETTISYVKIGNHPIETTIYKWLFGVPGSYIPSTKTQISPFKPGTFESMIFPTSRLVKTCERDTREGRDTVDGWSPAPVDK